MCAVVSSYCMCPFSCIYLSVSLLCRTRSIRLSLHAVRCDRVVFRSTISIFPSLYRVVPVLFLSLSLHVVPILFVFFFVIVVLLPVRLLLLWIVELIFNGFKWIVTRVPSSSFLLLLLLSVSLVVFCCCNSVSPFFFSSYHVVSTTNSSS